MIEEMLKTTLFLYLTKNIEKTGKIRFVTYREYTNYMDSYNPDLPLWPKYDFDAVIAYLKEQFKHLRNLITETDMTFIDEIILDKKINNFLHRANIHFAEHLISYSNSDLLKLRGIGPKAIETIDYYLNEKGFSRIEG